jgi:hypothetical protein
VEISQIDNSLACAPGSRPEVNDTAFAGDSILGGEVHTKLCGDLHAVCDVPVGFGADVGAGCDTVGFGFSYSTGDDEWLKQQVFVVTLVEPTT